MTNIFENAYFGKAYKTRDGSKAIFICQRTNNKIWDLTHPYACVVEGYGEIWNYYSDGRLYFSDGFETENDIISEWQEEINEEKLDELAEAYFLNTYNNGVKDPNLEIINEKEFAVADFKAGCRTILKTIKL